MEGGEEEREREKGRGRERKGDTQGEIRKGTYVCGPSEVTILPFAGFHHSLPYPCRDHWMPHLSLNLSNPQLCLLPMKTCFPCADFLVQPRKSPQSYVVILSLCAILTPRTGVPRGQGPAVIRLILQFSTPVFCRQQSTGQADTSVHFSYQEVIKGVARFLHLSVVFGTVAPAPGPTHQVLVIGLGGTGGGTVCPRWGVVLLYRTEGVVKSGSPDQKALECQPKHLGPKWEDQSHSLPRSIQKVELAWSRGTRLGLN